MIHTELNRHGMQTTTIKLDSSYKGNRFHFALSIFLAVLVGPFIIFMMAHTAVMNGVDDPVSWTLFGVCSLLFIFLSYSKFKYIYYTYYTEHSAEIDFQNKSIFFLPYKETVLLENVTALSYSKEFKSYRFTYSNLTNSRFEVKQNEAFEKALLKFSLECKEE